MTKSFNKILTHAKYMKYSRRETSSRDKLMCWKWCHCVFHKWELCIWRKTLNYEYLSYWAIIVTFLHGKCYECRSQFWYIANKKPVLFTVACTWMENVHGCKNSSLETNLSVLHIMQIWHIKSHSEGMKYSGILTACVQMWLELNK